MIARHESPDQAAFQRALSRPDVSGFESIVQNAPPDSCLGAMEEVLYLRRGRRLRVCDHLWEARGRGRWFVCLEDPDRIVCAHCVPGIYIDILNNPPRPVWLRCSCCGEMSWLSGPALMSHGPGTALALLCAACSAQRPAGVVGMAV
jgi:hypothetical protein